MADSISRQQFKALMEAWRYSLEIHNCTSYVTYMMPHCHKLKRRGDFVFSVCVFTYQKRKGLELLSLKNRRGLNMLARFRRKNAMYYCRSILLGLSDILPSCDFINYDCIKLKIITFHLGVGRILTFSNPF